ncbi:hypothetical protein [Lentilactobacillus sp. Marseille-Q4993]|uniref:hypothetical protein n=1 Tax=Lentilactobacillus sp. Marseille-Q4993 TaxID=3039492 RepID=UPI0024BC2AC7|nr:hypothetical protein [Lentilactobacillus sp. Marseille-Q4993]
MFDNYIQTLTIVTLGVSGLSVFTMIFYYGWTAKLGKSTSNFNVSRRKLSLEPEYTPTDELIGKIGIISSPGGVDNTSTEFTENLSLSDYYRLVNQELSQDVNDKSPVVLKMSVRQVTDREFEFFINGLAKFTNNRKVILEFDPLTRGGNINAKWWLLRRHSNKAQKLGFLISNNLVTAPDNSLSSIGAKIAYTDYIKFAAQKPEFTSDEVPLQWQSYFLDNQISVLLSQTEIGDSVFVDRKVRVRKFNLKAKMNVVGLER